MKGVAEIIGTVLLIAIAVVLVLLAATFFIDFTGERTREVQKGSPDLSVIYVSSCTPNTGEINLYNQLSQDISVGTRATIYQEDKQYAFVKTKTRAVPGKGNRIIDFEYGELDNPPFAFEPEETYTITFNEGPANGQSATFDCKNTGERFEVTIDSDNDMLFIKTTQPLAGNETPGSCNTTATSGADLFDVYAAFTQQGTSTDSFCLDRNVDVNLRFYQPAKLLKCNGTTCKEVDFTMGAVYTFYLNDSNTNEASLLEGQAVRVTAA